MERRMDTKQTPDARPSPTAGSTPPPLMGPKAWFLLALGLAVIAFASYRMVRLIDQNRVDARFAPRQFIDLDARATPQPEGPHQAAASRLALRVAIAPVVSPEKTMERYEAFVEYLARKVGRDPVCLRRPTYAETNELVRYGRCELALVCVCPFLRGERDFGMQALAVPQIRDAVTTHSVVVAPRSSEATSLLDLRGKRFASADIVSYSGWIVPALWLREQKEDPDGFFGEHILAGSHDRSVQAVLMGHADGAGVLSLVYDQMAAEDPTILERTKTVFKSEAFGVPPVVVHPALDGKLKEQLRAALVGMHKDPEGAKVLAALGIQRFVVPEATLFDSARALAKRWEAR